jgi:protein-tyrosine phosphatase
MRTKVIEVNPEKPDTSKIAEAAKIVDDGGLVVFPTETVYGIACLVAADSLEKLNQLKGRAEQKYYTLHIGQKSELKRYVPTIGLKAGKIVEKCWPGPLTIVFELDKRDLSGLKDTFERGVFECLYKDNSIGVRCPDHAVASKLLQMTKNPVVAPSANKTDQTPAVDGKVAVQQFSGQIDLVLDAGVCRYKQSSTVVRITDKELEILRAGAYLEEKLKEISEIKFLFVCTGNSCRSPMAEGFFRKYFAEKLDCPVDQLGKIGYKVHSAGTMGAVGLPATSEAIAACAAKGINIENHRSTALSKQLIEECDFIFVMSRMHRECVVGLNHEAADKCVLLANGHDIFDPIGQPQQVYDECARIIEEAVKNRISELVI